MGSIVCPLPPSGEHSLTSSRQRALGRSSGPASPTQARPGPHVLAWASSHRGTARCPLRWPPLRLDSRGHCLGTWEILAGWVRAWGLCFGLVRGWVHQGGTDWAGGKGKVTPWTQPWRVIEMSMSDFRCTRGQRAGANQWCDLGPPLSGLSYL